MYKIYLSPSNQPTNKYCVGNTNEKAEMEVIAKKIKEILDNEYECEVVMATLYLGIDAEGRAREAKDKGCHIYLAIHSNAGGGGKASGVVAFYHPDSISGKLLASNIVKELNAICPVKSNRNTSVENGMKAFNGLGYGEIRNPSRLGLITVLVETDFHDNPKTAQWILDNKDEIARAYVMGLVKALNIAKKAGPKRIYRVQVGAFSSKDNADKLLLKIKALGFKDAYIKIE